MVKQIFILITFLLSFANECMSTMTEPHLYTSYSSNKEYKLVVSPFFCNEVNCLTHEEIDSLEGDINKEFLSQKLFIYKKMSSEYVKIISCEVLCEQIYLDIPGSHYFISNDGQTVVLEDKLNIRWCIFKMTGPTFQLSEFRGEDTFGLSQKEYGKCCADIYGYTEKFNGCMVRTNVKNSLRIRIRYFSITHNKYVNKKTEIHF
jgi:hypothetical protein